MAKLKRQKYEKELSRLQGKLCVLQEWVKGKGLRVIVIFEGRDAAGKGGTIKAITERVSPRVFRVVALPAPSDREKSQMYLQRYMQHFPAAGEIVIFDRSWYNRAGVEHVMGFCTDEQYERFLKLCPLFERHLVEGGIMLIKFWLEVGNKEQERRFKARIDDPLRQWKLSPMDLPSRAKWYEYSRARDAMLKATDTRIAPWYIVRSDDKKRARLNTIAHLLKLIPHKKIDQPEGEAAATVRRSMPTTTRRRSPGADSCRRCTEHGRAVRESARVCVGDASRSCACRSARRATAQGRQPRRRSTATSGQRPSRRTKRRRVTFFNRPIVVAQGARRSGGARAERAAAPNGILDELVDDGDTGPVESQPLDGRLADQRRLPRRAGADAAGRRRAVRRDAAEAAGRTVGAPAAGARRSGGSACAAALLRSSGRRPSATRASALLALWGIARVHRAAIARTGSSPSPSRRSPDPASPISTLIRASRLLELSAAS